MGLVGIFYNRALICAVIGWFAAQLLKVIFVLMFDKKLDIRRFVGTGGMPSSHSSFVMSLTAYTGLSEGFNSTLFAVCFVIAFVVMYDAAGVRRAAGKQAKLLNKLVETPGLSGVEVSEKLVEVLGHTPLQVIV